MGRRRCVRRCVTPPSPARHDCGTQADDGAASRGRRRRRRAPGVGRRRRGRQTISRTGRFDRPRCWRTDVAGLPRWWGPVARGHSRRGRRSADQRRRRARDRAAGMVSPVARTPRRTGNSRRAGSARRRHRSPAAAAALQCDGQCGAARRAAGRPGRPHWFGRAARPARTSGRCLANAWRAAGHACSGGAVPPTVG